MKSVNRIIVAIIVFVCLVSLVIIVDYNNSFSDMGHDVSNYNFDVLSIVIGNAIVVLLYVVTYFLLDERNIHKEENKRTVAMIMLKSIYGHCTDIIEQFEDHQFLLNVIPHNNFMKSDVAETNKQHFVRLPFAENDASILAFSQDGILHGDEMEAYIRIKKLYIEYIGSFWIKGSVMDCIDQMYLRDELKKEIQNAVKKIEEVTI